VKTSTRRGGFTLLELLVVIALMGVVGTLGTQLFVTMTTSWGSVLQRTQLDEQADNVFDQMRHDFEKVVSPRLTGVSMTGADQTAEEERFWNQTLGNDTLTFAVLKMVDPKLETFRCVQAKYYVDRAEGKDFLIREVNDFARPDKKERDALGENVVSLCLEYLATDGTWAQAWDRPELPQAVRVSMTLVNPDSLEQVTRKAVFPVRVN
jgi:prepilin-type N-terminal cleavage/methylation domain-containing protein